LDASLSLNFPSFETSLPREELEFCEGIRLAARSTGPVRPPAQPVKFRAMPGGLFGFSLHKAIREIEGGKQPASTATSASPNFLANSLRFFLAPKQNNIAWGVSPRISESLVGKIFGSDPLPPSAIRA